MRYGSFCVLLVLLAVNLLALMSMTHAQETDIRIEGLENNSDLSDWVDEAALQKFEEREETITSRFAGIEVQVEKALKSKGYYEPNVTFENSGEPVISVQTGPQYVIGKLKIEGDDRTLQNVEEGDILDAASILKAQEKLKNEISKDTCYYSLTVKNQVVLNKAMNTGDVTIMVEKGDIASFGPTTFKGAPTIKTSYLENFIKYEQGACWDAGKIEKTKNALISTGLLSVVNETLPDKPYSDGTVPVIFDLKERSPRTIRLGASYYTDEGPGIVVGWQHRNLFGAGEELDTNLRANFLEQSLSADFEKPFFGSEDQTLNIDAELSHLDSDAYEEYKISASVNLQKDFTDNLSGSLGGGIELSRIQDKTDMSERTFGLFSIPASLHYDNRDDPLNPKKGWTWGVETTPYLDALGNSSPFWKTTLPATTYFGFGEEKNTVLALRGRLGTINGAETDDIPASKRFYAGGGGSIRGFGFQEAGPKDEDDNPIGGRSLLETSTELRFKITDTIGAVGFIDAGGVSDAQYPDFQDGMYVGTGVGLRYYTGFGPVRFDVATPVNRREEAEQPVYFYISIGQAF